MIALAEVVKDSPAVSLSVVDTFGAMYEENLERIASVLDRCLRPEIALGFHSHNNQQISLLSLTKLAVALDCAEEIRAMFSNVVHGSTEEVIDERKG